MATRWRAIAVPIGEPVGPARTSHHAAVMDAKKLKKFPPGCEGIGIVEVDKNGLYNSEIQKVGNRNL